MRVTGGAEALCGHIISDHHIIIMGRCHNRRKAGQHCSKISISTLYRIVSKWQENYSARKGARDQLFIWHQFNFVSLCPRIKRRSRK